MRRSLTVYLFLLGSLLYTRPAHAQDTRAFGVTMGFPTSIGVLWHVAEGVAIRPEVSFDVFSSETETSSPIGVDTESDGHSISVGLSALFYLARWDMTRAYVVPRYLYSTTSTSTDGPFAGVSTDADISGHSFGVSFGAQHALGERFAVYGELGLEFEKSSLEITTTEQDRTAFGTRSAVGIVVYF